MTEENATAATDKVDVVLSIAILISTVFLAVVLSVERETMWTMLFGASLVGLYLYKTVVSYQDYKHATSLNSEKEN